MMVCNTCNIDYMYDCFECSNCGNRTEYERPLHPVKWRIEFGIDVETILTVLIMQTPSWDAGQILRYVVQTGARKLRSELNAGLSWYGVDRIVCWRLREGHHYDIHSPKWDLVRCEIEQKFNL